MNRAVFGTVAERESGRPVMGIVIIAAKVISEGLEVLGGAVSGDWGHFRITYSPVAVPVDLTLLLFSDAGRLLFREPVHRGIAGAELSLRVEVPLARLRPEMN